MNLRILSRIAISLVAIALGFTGSAMAGPPLLCHPFAIGQAKSLPSPDLNDQQGNGVYSLQNLTQDTLAILDSNPPVLVRMETLRRATLYAQRDPQVAKDLLTRLYARTANASANNIGALAWFDLGYLTETYKQGTEKGELNPASGLDGYSWVRKAISLRGQDPEMEFAAALITLTGPESDHRAHLQKAITGAKNDSLLAQNLASPFNRQMTSALLNNPSTGGRKR
jgi:hypothetical protein